MEITPRPLTLGGGNEYIAVMEPQTYEKEKNAYASAFQAFQRTVESAEAARRAFRDAGIQLPTPLSRFFGEGGNGGRPKPGLTFEPPSSPERPPNAGEDWIWLPVEESSPATLVVALLIQAKGEPVKPRRIIEQIGQLGVVVNPGSVHNIIYRLLNKGELSKTKEGVTVMPAVTAPVLLNKHVWGPKTVFGIHELAAHRRIIIVHLLESAPGGLQIMQVVNYLQNAEFCRAPVTKDLLKADFEALQKSGRARRVSNSKKWVLTKKENA